MDVKKEEKDTKNASNEPAKLNDLEWEIIDTRSEIRKIAMKLTGLLFELWEIVWGYLSRQRGEREMILFDICAGSGARVFRAYSDEYAAATSLSRFLCTYKTILTQYPQYPHWPNYFSGKGYVAFTNELDEHNYERLLSLTEQNTTIFLNRHWSITIYNVEINKQSFEKFWACPAEEEQEQMCI